MPRVSGAVTIAISERTLNATQTAMTPHGEPSQIDSSHTASTGIGLPATRLAPVYASAEPEYRTNHHLFQIANVTVNVTAIRAQVDDGVADELTGTVIRDVPAASRLDYLHAFFL